MQTTFLITDAQQTANQGTGELTQKKILRLSRLIRCFEGKLKESCF